MQREGGIYHSPENRAYLGPRRGVHQVLAGERNILMREKIYTMQAVPKKELERLF